MYVCLHESPARRLANEVRSSAVTRKCICFILREEIGIENVRAFVVVDIMNDKAQVSMAVCIRLRPQCFFRLSVSDRLFRGGLPGESGVGGGDNENETVHIPMSNSA